MNSTRTAMDSITDAILMSGMWPLSRETTKENIEVWQKQWLVDSLKGYRYGQSFCEFFGICNSSPLYHFKDKNISQRWIDDNYLNGGPRGVKRG